MAVCYAAHILELCLLFSNLTIFPSDRVLRLFHRFHDVFLVASVGQLHVRSDVLWYAIDLVERRWDGLPEPLPDRNHARPDSAHDILAVQVLLGVVGHALPDLSTSIHDSDAENICGAHLRFLGRHTSIFSIAARDDRVRDQFHGPQLLLIRRHHGRMAVQNGRPVIITVGERCQAQDEPVHLGGGHTDRETFGSIDGIRFGKPHDPRRDVAVKVAVERLVKARAWMLERSHDANHGQNGGERVPGVGRKGDVHDEGIIDD